jgi:hypothetical protein
MIGPLPEDRPAPPPAKRMTPRRIAENTATALIAAGVLMMMQPLSMTLYTWSFAVTLAGTVLFIVGSKFPG